MNFEQQTRQLSRIVAHQTFFLEQVAANQLKPTSAALPADWRMKLAFEACDQGSVEFHLSRTVVQILFLQFRADWCRIDHHIVYKQVWTVFKEHAQMVRYVKIVSFTRLGHYVADVNLQ